MTHQPNRLSRRRVLELAGGSLALAGVAGAANAGTGEATTFNVGYRAESGRRAAVDAADAVLREFAFDAVTIRGSAEAVRGLERRGDVRYVEVDGTMHALGPGTDAPGGNPGPPGGGGGGDANQCLPWGVDRVDGDVAHANGDAGDGAHVAIIDTGIDDDHPDLQANVGSGKAFVDCRGRNCNYPWSDDDDHGTHCAGIANAVNNGEGVVGVSTQATLHAVKVLDKSGSGSFSDVAAGIEYVADQGWDVGSMSLGASSGSQTVKDACSYAYDAGVLLVAAAGNSGPCSDCVGYPAAYSEVMAVSSTTQSDGLSGFSSTGPEVEIAAPGSSVYSTVIDGYDTFSGTSMACPHVSGAGGQLMADGTSNSNARKTLKSNAEDVGLSGNESGAGLLDVAAALGHDSSDDGTGSC